MSKKEVLPICSVGWDIVDIGGKVSADCGSPSNPNTEIFSGTLIPSDLKT